MCSDLLKGSLLLLTYLGSRAPVSGEARGVNMYLTT